MVSQRPNGLESLEQVHVRYDPRATGDRALAGSAPAVHQPCFYTQLVIAAFALRDLLQPAVPRRIPA